MCVCVCQKELVRLTSRLTILMANLDMSIFVFKKIQIISELYPDIISTITSKPTPAPVDLGQILYISHVSVILYFKYLPVATHETLIYYDTTNKVVCEYIQFGGMTPDFSSG